MVTRPMEKRIWSATRTLEELDREDCDYDQIGERRSLSPPLCLLHRRVSKMSLRIAASLGDHW